VPGSQCTTGEGDGVGVRVGGAEREGVAGGVPLGERMSVAVPVSVPREGVAGGEGEGDTESHTPLPGALVEAPSQGVHAALPAAAANVLAGHCAQEVAPSAPEKKPGAQLAHEALPAAAANVPRKQL